MKICEEKFGDTFRVTSGLSEAKRTTRFFATEDGLEYAIFLKIESGKIAFYMLPRWVTLAPAPLVTRG